MNLAVSPHAGILSHLATGSVYRLGRSKWRLILPLWLTASLHRWWQQLEGFFDWIWQNIDFHNFWPKVLKNENCAFIPYAGFSQIQSHLVTCMQPDRVHWHRKLQKIRRGFWQKWAWSKLFTRCVLNAIQCTPLLEHLPMPIQYSSKLGT